MKFLIFAVCVLIATVTAEDWKPHTAEELLKYRELCITESNLNSNTIDQIKKYQYSDEDVVRKYLVCFGTKTGFLVNDKFVLDRAVEQFKFDLPAETAKAIFTKCITENKKDTSIYDYIVPVQNCFIASQVGEKIKAHKI